VGAHDQISHVLAIVFILGALMFYSVLYQSKLVPRWLSGWGLLAAIPYFVSGVFGLFSLPNPMSMVLPMALQEMVLAIWLVVRGFDASPVNVGSVEVAVSQAEVKRPKVSP